MVTQIELLSTDKLVVVVGLPGSGKSTLANILHHKFPQYHLIQCDEYIDEGLSTHQMIYDINCNPAPMKIVEGVSCYRMLKEGLEERCFYPDVVVNVLATEQLRGKRRPDKNYKQMDATLRLIWLTYNRMPNERAPRIIELLNE
jgi:hypothetical protein